MALVMDLGCGTGRLPFGLHVDAGDEVVGVDKDAQKIAIARRSYPMRQFECAPGEDLPFPDSSFDCVVSNGALASMDIPTTLAEVRRVLIPRGRLYLRMRAPSFALRELRKCRGWLAGLGRLYVIVNGCLFHVGGKTLRIAERSESFQTERGMRIALRRAGFVSIAFSRSQAGLEVQARSTFPTREASPVRFGQPAVAN